MTVAVTTVVRDLRPEDWPQVASIYEDGIRTGNGRNDALPGKQERKQQQNKTLHMIHLLNNFSNPSSYVC